jgi:hypothetical protein
MSCYLHHVPGRIRIKTPTIKGYPFRALELEKKVGAIYGVVDASANALTGSLIVNYDPDVVDARTILDVAAKELRLDLSLADGHDRYMDETLSKTGEKIGKAVFSIALGLAFEGTPLGLLTAII